MKQRALILTSSLFCAVLGTLFASPAGADGSPDPWHVQVTRPRRFAVHLPKLPPSRVIVSFDASDGRHEALTWTPDPHEHLVKTVVLPPGCWAISFAADAIRPASMPTLDLAWGIRAAEPKIGESSALPGCRDGDAGSATAITNQWTADWVFDEIARTKADGPAAGTSTAPASGQTSDTLKLTVTIMTAANPKLVDAARALVQSEGGATGGVGNDAITQQASTAPLLAAGNEADLGGVLSALVLAKLETMASQKVRDEATDAFCNTITEPSDRSGAKRPIFDHTCEAFRRLDVRDLAVSGRALLFAVRSDVEEVMARRIPMILETELLATPLTADQRAVWLDMVRRLIAIERVNGAGSAESDLASIAELARVDWIETFAKDRTACEIELGLATIASCQSKRCTAREVIDLVDSAADHFDLGDCKEVLAPSSPQARADHRTALALANAGVRALSGEGSKRDGEGDVEAVDAVLTALARLGCTSVDCKRIVANVSAVLRGLRTRDVQLIMSQGMRFIVSKADEGTPGSESERKIHFATRVLGALAILLDDAERNEARVSANARARALEALLDEPFDRAQRGGEWLWSIGVGPKAATGSRCVGSDCQLDFGLSIPGELAIERLFKYQDYGLHFGLEVGNLGNYLTTTSQNTRWFDVASFGASFSLFRGRNFPVTLGFEADWQPREGTDIYRLIFGLGVYAPLVPLN